MFKMKGVVPPMITPFKESSELDEESLKSLLSFLKKHVHGVFICGSYGCGPLMTVEERKKVAEICVEQIGDDVDIVVHTGTTNTRDTVDLTKHAEAIGAHAASAVGPYYYHHKPDAVLEFYGTVLKNISSDFPFYVYDNPKFSGYAIPLETMKQLKEMGIAGTKAAAFDIIQFATYMRELADETYDVVLGTEAMWLSARALGCEAFIPGLGNAFPEICSRMWEEGMAYEIEKCRQTQFDVNVMRDVMYLANSTQLAVYAMLEIRGIIASYPRSPFVAAGEKEKKAIRERLTELGVI